jgi:hypothetical protein
MDAFHLLFALPAIGVLFAGLAIVIGGRVGQILGVLAAVAGGVVIVLSVLS